MTTHKMKEVMASSDRISVMRKGKMIATLMTGRRTNGSWPGLMVGREVTISRQEREATAGRAAAGCQGSGGGCGSWPQGAG